MTLLLITTNDKRKFSYGKPRKKKKKSRAERMGAFVKKKQPYNNSVLFTNQSKNVQKDGKDYLVVPGVPVQEQVMNTYLLPADEIEKSLSSWNGTPLSIRHAQKNGGSVMVDEPDVPIIGYFDNVSWDAIGKRMLGDYWIDTAEASKYPEGLTILNSIKNGQMVETSTAYWADEEYKGGLFKGKSYATIHRNPKRDHIAIFPNDQLGACSVADGCGLNRNMKHNKDCRCIKLNMSDYKSGYLPTEMLIGYALNKGSRTQAEIDSMREYVGKNGITKSVWIKRNSDGKICILDGNHRVYLAQELGIEQVPVRVIDEHLNSLDTEAVYREWLYEQDQSYLK